MFKINNTLSLVLLIANIVFLLYYSFQLLVFTDEFALNNIGFFNHAIAGLSEILGIIFFSLALGLVIILFVGLDRQYPLIITIFLMEAIIGINFWRYVLTNSPGQTDIGTITFNACVFSIISLTMLILIIFPKNS